MPRRLRFASGGYVFHALNRAVGRATLFDKSLDYVSFEKVLRQAQEQVPMRLLAFCLMLNHWHLVLLPENDDELSACMHWLSLCGAQPPAGQSGEAGRTVALVQPVAPGARHGWPALV